MLGLPVNRVGRSEANDYSFDSQQTTGLQRVALEGHRQREDKLDDQKPAGHERAGRESHNRV